MITFGVSAGSTGSSTTARVTAVAAIVAAVALGLLALGRSGPPADTATGDGGAAADGGGAEDDDADGGRLPGDETPAPAPKTARATLVGDVFDENGWPVAGAQIVVVGEDALGAPIAARGAPAFAARLEPAGELGILRGVVPFPPRQPTTAGGGVLPGAVCDDKGRFRIPDLPPGRLVVVASHPAFVEGRSDEVAIVAGGEARVQLALKRGLELRARIADARGPISGAELWRAGELCGIADAAGFVALRGLDGVVELEARARSHLPRRRSVDPAIEHEVELTLDRAAGRVTGVVVDERGFPVGGAKVAAEQGAWRADSASDSHGEFAIEGVPEGRLAVRASHPDHPALALEAAAAGDDLRLQLQPGAGVEGDVRDDRTGALVPSVRVTVECSGQSRPAPVDKRGRFRLLGCAAGAATVLASAEGYLPRAVNVDLPPGERAREVTLRDLRVELTLGGALQGELRDGRGDPARDVEVEAGGLRARTDAAGRFRLGPLAPGTVEVKAGAARDHALIEAGAVARVDLRLP